MKSYFFISKIRIQTALAYRFNVISTILIQCLIMYAMSCFWIAAYDGTQTVAGVSQRDMITYTMISVAIGNLLTIGVQSRIAKSVRTGSVALDMLKPVCIYGIYLAEDIGDLPLCFRKLSRWFWWGRSCLGLQDPHPFFTSSCFCSALPSDTSSTGFWPRCLGCAPSRR